MIEKKNILFEIKEYNNTLLYIIQFNHLMDNFKFIIYSILSSFNRQFYYLSYNLFNNLHIDYIKFFQFV